MCGSRHDDDVNGIWVNNPANHIVGNHIITDGDAAFRFETRGLTGRAQGGFAPGGIGTSNRVNP